VAEKVKKRVAVLGPGAIGGFLVGALTKAGCEVTLVARPGTASQIAKNGLCLKTALLGDMVARPQVVENLESTFDVIGIATKANDLIPALSQIRAGIGEGTIIIPFLNGIEHIALLKKEFGKHVVVGMIGNIVAEKEREGCVVSSSTNVTIELGSESISQRALEEIADLFRPSGIVVSVEETEAKVIWHKLARLSVLAGITAASGKTLGELRKDSLWNSRLEECAREIAEVARKDGVEISADEILKQIETLPDSLTTSLARDVERADAGEVDAILGAVIRRADTYGIAHKTFDELFSLVRKRLES